VATGGKFVVRRAADAQAGVKRMIVEIASLQATGWSFTAFVHSGASRLALSDRRLH
jgi:hypothetical protein